MKRTVLKFASAATAILGLVAVAPGAAHATASPGFSGSYDFTNNLVGATTFTVTGDGKVTVSLTQTAGRGQYYKVRIERQKDGKWPGTFPGGDCTRGMSEKTTSVCNFTTGNSTAKHRILIDHYWDQNLTSKMSDRTVGVVTVK
ncbi:MAG: hypothetical protein ACOYN3_00570 [Acidimicrobiia bacterium]